MSTLSLLIAWIGLAVIVAVILGKLLTRRDETWRDFDRAERRFTPPDDIVQVRRGPYDWSREDSL